MPNEQTFSHETAALIIRALEQSGRPLSKTDLEKMIPKSAQIAKKDLPELLKQLAKTGQLRAHGTRRKSYWLPEMEAPASERILEALREAPLTKTDLENKLRSWLHDWPKSKRDEMVARLIKEQRVYKVAALTGKASLLSARPQATTQDYVRLALQLAITKLAKRGIRSEEVLAAAQAVLQGAPSQSETVPPPPVPVDLSQLLLDRMFQLNSAAATGAPVSLSELRRAMHFEFSDKSSFDQTVLSLAGQNRVALQRHDHADSLSQTEQDLLVADNQGNYFISVTLRV